jgi:glycerophosphoryl diester phosphodiesterase
VAEHTLAELQALDAGSWFGATFADMLTHYQGRAHMHTELNGHTEHLAQHTADLVWAHGMVEHVTMTSFHKPHLEEIWMYVPEFPTGWLVGEVSNTVIAQTRELGCTQLCPRAHTITPALVHRLHAEGFVVPAWGVANEGLMRRVVEAGANGMTVNFPDTLLAYLEQRASQRMVPDQLSGG